MAHRFCVSAEWGRSLSQQAPVLRRDRSLAMKIVSQNAQIVKEGAYGVGPPPPTERVQCPADPVVLRAPIFEVTEVCVANIDTQSAALLVGDACSLNFANAYTPGGGYRRGASAQEEDLCRCLPQLIHSLEACKYPIQPDEVLLTRDLAAVRDVGSYELCQSMGSVHILTSAMPCGDAGRPGGTEWNSTVRLRMRAVLHAAKLSGLPNLVLGAWGCGAFGNPPVQVAALFREQLCSPEFRGVFAHILFAVIDPAGDGNFAPFEQEIALMDEVSA